MENNKIFYKISTYECTDVYFTIQILNEVLLRKPSHT